MGGGFQIISFLWGILGKWCKMVKLNPILITKFNPWSKHPGSALVDGNFSTSVIDFYRD